MKRAIAGDGLARPGPEHSAVDLYRRANRLMSEGKLEEAASAYRQALQERPDFPEACTNLGLVLKELGRPAEAEAMLRRAVSLAPARADVAANLRLHLAGAIPAWQYPMANDRERNEAYRRAIEQTVRAGDHVLEIGAGSGLLSMMAARAGAARVDACEMLELLARKAEEIVEANGLGKVVSVIPQHSSHLAESDLDGRADVLISEIVASDLIGEGVLQTMEDAIARLAKPDARVIPSHGTIRGQLAGCEMLERYLRLGTVEGMDLRALNEYAPASVFPEDLGIELDAYSAPFDVFEFDFRAGAFPTAKNRFAVHVTADGVCHGMLQWIRLTLAPGVALENGPWSGDVGKGHWKRMLYAFPAPLPVTAGQVLNLSVAHNRRNLIVYLG